MLIKEIKYIDYNGKERTETFYFNLNKAEVVELDFEYEGGIIKKLNDLAQHGTPKELLEFFKQLVSKAYGEKTEDGRRLVKSDEVFTKFSQTEAYSELFTELLSSEESMSAFVNGVVPKVD